MLALVLAAVTTATLPPDGSYKYTLSVMGQLVGSTTITLKTQASGIALSESGSLIDKNTSGATTTGATTTMTFDSALDPTRYTASYETTRGTGTSGETTGKGSGVSTNVGITFAGNTATETSSSGSESFALSADTKHFVVIDGALFSGFFILPAQVQAWGNVSFFTIAPMYGRGGPITIDTILRPDRPKGVAASDAAISISTPVTLTIWYDPKTMIVSECDIPSQQAVYQHTK